MTKDTEALRDDQWSDANMLRSIARDVDRWPSNATCDGAPTSADTLREIADRLDAALATPASDVAPVAWFGPIPHSGRQKPEWLPDEAIVMIAFNPRDCQTAMTWGFAAKRKAPAKDRDWENATAFCVEIPLAQSVDPVAGGEAWTCAARKQGSAGGNDPADCDWPFCGCDPYADKVLAVVEESALAALKGPAA